MVVIGKGTKVWEEDRVEKSVDQSMCNSYVDMKIVATRSGQDLLFTEKTWLDALLRY